MTRLLVIMYERFSHFVRKGEIIDRYFNPGDVFDDVVLVLTNDDPVDVRDLMPLAGRARFSLHNLPRPRFLSSLGWRPWLMTDWLARGLRLAQEIKPDVIRCYGNVENGYLGAHLKRHLGLPFVVSLHGDLDEDVRGKTPWWPDWKDRLVAERQRFFEEESLKAADIVLPVYEPIVSYARRLGARDIRVCYNMTNQKSLRQKETYSLQQPPSLVSVGRQVKREKNPENVIRAVSKMNARLTLIGSGPYHETLKRIAGECRGPGKIDFIPALSNDELCRRLPTFDLFVTQTENFEISKAVIEAMLTGLPIVLNRRKGRQVPELAGDWVHLVDDTPDSYQNALEDLLRSDAKREALGRRAFERSHARYEPHHAEDAFAQIYRGLLSTSTR